MNSRVLSLFFLCLAFGIQLSSAQVDSTVARIDSASAVNIAFRVGLKKGIQPIAVQLYYKNKIPQYWIVSALQKRSINAETRRLVRINPFTGAIIEDSLVESTWDSATPVQHKE